MVEGSRLLRLVSRKSGPLNNRLDAAMCLHDTNPGPPMALKFSLFVISSCVQDKPGYHQIIIRMSSWSF